MVSHPRSWTLMLTHAYFVLKVFFVVHSLSHVQLFATPWTAACQAPLSSTISQSLLKFMSIEVVMLSNYLVLCRPLLLLPSVFPSIQVFPNKVALCIRWPEYKSFRFCTSPWFPLGLTGWISLQSKGLSRVFSNTTVWKHQFFGAQPSFTLGFPDGSDGKEYACNVGDQVRSLGQEDHLEKGMATHSSILAWKIPWT